VVVLLLTGFLANLPTATLAGLIVYAALGLLNPKAWIVLVHGSKVEAAIAATLTLGMLTIGLLPSLALAVLLSILDVVRTSARPHDAVLGWGAEQGRFVDVGRHPEAVIVPGVVVYRLDDRLFFANSDYFASRLREAVAAAPYEVSAVVFDAEAVVDLDASGAEKLRALVDDLDSRDIDFHLARTRQAFEKHLDRLGLEDVIPKDHRHHTVRGAVLAASGIDITADT
jgi:SulP family sulfate permease